MDLSCCFLILILIITVIYWFLTRTYNHWEKQNIPFVQNALPGFGHMFPIITFKENITTFLDKMYKQSNTSLTGFFFLRKPALLIRDPELIKSVLQINFMSFRNNGIVLSEKADPVLSKNPFFTSNYQSWKDSRIRVASHLSNKKLNYLFIILQDVCNKMKNYLDRKIQDNDGYFECELKKEFSRFTGEVVANSAFAIEGQSFEDNPDKLAFTNVANNLFETTLINGIKQALIFYMPDIANLFNMSFLQKRTDNYFRKNLKAIINQRKKSNTMPNDFLQFCINTNSEDDVDGIISDVIVFYLDIYETTSTALSILFYHLSKNPEIQKKLRIHINSVLEPTSGVITYDSLKKMNYFEEVLFESIRLLPPVGVLIKVCTKEITLTGSDGLTCKLHPGNLIFISLLGLHSDDKHWSEPHIFDPSRFSNENQTARNKYIYLGFSEGPRMCVGIRLAIMVMKHLTTSLLTKYSIEHSPKTKIPLELVPSSFITYVKGGLWAKFQKLNNKN